MHTVHRGLATYSISLRNDRGYIIEPEVPWYLPLGHEPSSGRDYRDAYSLLTALS
jgi:hypothetical protein